MGFTLVELLVVVAIIGIAAVISFGAISRFRATPQEYAQDAAYGLREFLNLAKIESVGSTSPIIVAFDPANQFYYAFRDDNKNGKLDYPSEECTDTTKCGQTLRVNIPAPDNDTINGDTVYGVKFKHNVLFGTFTPASSTASVPANEMGDIQLSGKIYFRPALAGTPIPANGLFLSGTGGNAISFNRDDTSDSGEIYLYYRSDDNNSFHYAFWIGPTGKIELYYWTPVGGAYCWKKV